MRSRKPTARRLKAAVQDQLHRVGFDLARWPHRTSEDARLAKALERRQIDTVLDVGAHQGEWALGLRKLCYAGRIVSYEPGSHAFGKLVAAAAHDPSWEARRAAAGRKRGTALLQVRQNTMMSSLRSVISVPDSYRDQVEVEATETVDVIRLEDEWPGGRVMLKVDTQGSDLEVIAGCGDRLADVLMLQIELAFRTTYEGQPDYLSALSHVAALGFEPMSLTPFWWDDEGHALEADCVLIR